MGEISDMITGDMVDPPDHYYEPDPEDPDFLPMGRRPTKTKTCRYCGKEGLFWQETEHGWRLCEKKDGELVVVYMVHDCPVAPLPEKSKLP